MDEIARREAKVWLRASREATGEAKEQTRRAMFALRYALKATICGATRHRWNGWEPSGTLFTPPERNRCRRCGGVQYRGKFPAIKPVFRWIQD